MQKDESQSFINCNQTQPLFVGIVAQHCLPSFGRQKCLGWAIHDLAFPAFHVLLGLFAFLFDPYKLSLDSHRLKVTHLVLHKRCQGRNHYCDRFAFDKGLTVSKTISADWKINDFPDPVGWITITSWPLLRFCSASRWESFKFWSLKYSKTRSKAKFILSTSSAILTTLFWSTNWCDNPCQTKIFRG